MNVLVPLVFLLALFVILAMAGWYLFCRSTDFYEDVSKKIDENIEQMAPALLVPDVAHGISDEDRKVRALLRLRLLGWPMVVVLLVSLTIGLTMSLSGRRTLDPLDIQQFSGQTHIRMALSKEGLVPPSPLPPALFLNTERQGLAEADRDWGKLDPVFMKPVLVLFNQMHKRGYQMALLEGYRSPDRQDHLAAQGSGVTHAKANQSKHQYGLAVDVAPMKDGKLVISERDPWAAEAYKILGEEVESLGMTWGGRWSFRDYGHFELAGPLAALIKEQLERRKK